MSAGAFSLLTAAFLENGRVTELSPEESVRGETRGTLTWYRLVVAEPEGARAWLRETFRFHELATEDAVSDHERPGATISADETFVTLPAPRRSGESWEFVHLGVFARPGLVVSVSTSACANTDAWYSKWESSPGAVGTTASDLLHTMADDVVDGYFPLLDQIQESIDDLEEEVFRGERYDPSKAVKLRRALVEARRQAGPLRDVINGLLRKDSTVIDQASRLYFQDVYDHSLRVVESIDLSRDVLTSIMDAQLTLVSNRLNEVMRNMTSIATVLMAMALVTGVYGMNFEHMPELREPWGYPAVLGLLALMFFGGMGIATKIGWLTVRWPWNRR
jgi:magnesium transporter